MARLKYYPLPDLEVTRGDRVIKLLRFDRRDGETTEPFNLTQFDAIGMDFRKEPHYESELYVSLSLGDGLSIVGDNDNELLIDISSEKSRGFAVGKLPVPISQTMAGTAPDPVFEGQAYYQLSFIKAGQISSTGKGICKVLANVTKLPK